MRVRNASFLQFSNQIDGRNWSVACVNSTPQEQSNVEEAGLASTSAGGILITPPKWQYAVPTKLISDPIMTRAALKQFTDTIIPSLTFSCEA
jgi:hypothetical protein